MALIAPITATQGIDIGAPPSTARDQSVARGVQNFGNAIGGAGDVAMNFSNQMLERQMKLERFALDQKLRAADAEIDTEVTNQVNNLDPLDDPSGTKLLSSIGSTVREKYDAALVGVPEGRRKEIEPQLVASTSVILSGASKQRAVKMQAWTSDQLAQQLDEHVSAVANNPALYDSAVKSFDASVDSSGLYRISAETAKRNGRISLGTAVADRDLREDPFGLAQRLGIDGVEPIDNYFASVRTAESGGNDAAKSTTSSATGRYGFTAGTWADLIKTHPDAGLTADGRLDGRQQEVAIRLLTAENEKVLRQGGVPISNGSRYAAHFLGAQGAVGVLSAPTGAAVAGLVDPSVVKANPFLADMTVGDFRQWAAKKGGGNGVTTPTLAPEFAALPYDARRQLYDQASAAGKADIETAVVNAPAAISNTGRYTGVMPSPQEFTLAYGPQDGAAKSQAFEASVAVAQSSYQMRTMPPAEIAATVQAAIPTSSGTDAKLQQDKYDLLSRAADDTLKARKADPATYTSTVFPEVAKAWTDATAAGAKPEAFGLALALTAAAQERLGITQPVLLPKTVVDSAMIGWKNPELGEQDRAGAVASLVMRGSTAEQQRAIFKQLTDAGLPDMAAGAMDALVRGDHGAAQRLFRAALVDPDKLPGKASETPDKVREAIQSGLMAPGAIGDVYYGISGGDASNLARAIQDQQLMFNAVELRLRNGENLDGAVDAVGKDLFGDVKPINGPNIAVLVDPAIDAGAVQTGFEQLLPRVRTAITASSGVPAGAKASDSSKAIFIAAEKYHADDIVAQGHFRNAGDGFQFIDPFDGSAIEGADGKPLTFTLDQVLAAAASAPPPVDPLEQERLFLEQQSAAFGPFGGAVAPTGARP